jgi:hypothetical protein
MEANHKSRSSGKETTTYNDEEIERRNNSKEIVIHPDIQLEEHFSYHH